MTARQKFSLTLATIIASVTATAVLALTGSSLANESRLSTDVTPRQQPAAQTQAWALDAIHRRAPADHTLTLKVRVLQNDWPQWLRAMDAAATARDWYAHDISLRQHPHAIRNHTGLTLLLPADQLPQAAAIAADPYAWTAGPHPRGNTTPEAAPAFVQINLVHANHGPTLQKTALLTLSTAILTALLATAAVLQPFETSPKEATPA